MPERSDGLHLPASMRSGFLGEADGERGRSAPLGDHGGAVGDREMTVGGRDCAVSVLVPTFRRPESLARCLRALVRQTRRANQIVVTVRRDDAATWEALEGLQAELGPALQPVAVEPGPVTAAMNAGLQETIGDLVAITDDDSEPRSDWLVSILRHFQDPTVGGVGGRDWQPQERWDEPDVGRLQWFGRIVANHHLGIGPARDVDVLKGVNCCYRGDVLRLIRLDPRMRGRGTVIHWELALSFAFQREGWRLIYDPAVAVDHHVAPRRDGDVNQRGGFERASFIDNVHNETLAVLEHLTPVRRVAFAAWAVLVGTREAPGLAQVPRLGLLERSPLGLTARRTAAALHGRAVGAATWLRDRHKAETRKELRLNPLPGDAAT